MSIAHYDFQNARKESLLSQNQVISEDMNAKSNIKEKNINEWSFDFKVIKINIKKKLNAWILNDEADDLIIFIKYMTHQHDIEIKIHNDMIQILNDVNKNHIELKVINIELKATQIMLNAVQMCLQKEMKKKNIIIHYLEAISSQLSTSILKDQFSKLIKLFDSSLFEDSRQNVNN